MRIIENAWIPMADGVRLAAKLWLPADVAAMPAPAVLEYIPYRKRDFRSPRDSQVHGYFARHGYAAVRVDLRGSGDSDGVLHDEYLPRELEDGVEVIRWIAAQPWCNGRVGMIGLSWGGFNALQIAALRPPALEAVISVCSSDDRYTDDVHYMGGCLLTDNLSWASVMLSYNACPPDPAIVGARWREMWLARLESSEPWLKTWLAHQRRDAYWRHGSVCEDFTAIRCPVFAVSGWADGYCNTVFRLLQHLGGPRKGLIGPWGHKYPHLGGPGPSIDFLGECLRWWDRWLRDLDNGVEREPMLRAWMQDSVSPISDDRPGRWVAEPGWPGPRLKPLTFALTRQGLAAGGAGDDEEADLSIRSPLSVGLFAGKWCSYAESTDLPTDQRLEDGGSLCFDTPPLEADLEMLGQAVVELEVAADRPQAMVAVRLSDIAPDGSVTLVTYGLLNLSHRHGHHRPEPLRPGEPCRVRVRLNHVAQCFPAGNRLRLAISSSYWPLAWPSPLPTILTLRLRHCRLSLPQRPRPDREATLPDLGEPHMAMAPAVTLLVPAHREWTVHFNLATNEASLNVIDNDGSWRLEEQGLTLGYDVTERYRQANDDYATLCGEVVNRRFMARGDWRVEMTSRTQLTSTPSHFHLNATLDAYEGGERIFSRTWNETLPRDHL
ncbi:CocE/NonD family hydrolase [Halomonas organivorans]|uniref:Xaa-Pro dipeptidyl-peptidase C-terminal domain-containing protein n=1 Tax=Halomonas organivorans TaxID=257772 RepID=A0A7W5G6L4_9GAMM|nr:hypothetical protein [Halomonas organivorans]